MLPDQIMTRYGRVDPHASRSYPRRVTEPQMGGFPMENFLQVRWPGRRLKGECLKTHKLVMEVHR